MEELFDLSNLDDIPDAVKEGVNVDIFAERILELFHIAGRELSVDEITIGYYRKYKGVDEEIKTKRQIMSKVYAMSKETRAKIKSVSGKKGIYQLNESPF